MNINLELLLTFVFFAPIALMVALNVMWMRTPGYEIATAAAAPSGPVAIDERVTAMEAANEGEARRAA